jgi:tetratricopeptide (TPR) repeat protein
MTPTNLITHIFCPVCDTLLLRQPTCPTCGWSRPGSHIPLGTATAPPIPLGHTVSGHPARLGQHIWYAAPPENNDLPGHLLAIRPGPAKRHTLPLTNFNPPPSLPVTLNLTGDKQSLYLTLRDYAISGGRTPKNILHLDEFGQPHQQLPTPSIELSSFACDPYRPQGYVVGIAPDQLYCFRLEEETAEPSWTIPVTANLFVAPLPTIEHLLLIAGTHFNGFTLQARDPQNGTLRWESHGTPYPILSDNHQLYLIRTHSVDALDLHTGASRWQYHDLRRTSQGVTTAPLALTTGLLLIGSGQQGGGYAVYGVDTQSGQRRWSFSTPSHVMQISPIGTSIIVGDRQENLFALNAEDGTLLWQSKLSSRICAHPFALEDILYVPTRDGQLHRLRWRISPPAPPASGPDYGRQNDWFNGAAAHALADPPNYAAAGLFMLKADRPDLALPLFKLADDPVKQAEALAQLGQYEEALAIFPADNGLSTVNAEWLKEVGRYDEAGQIYRQAQAWLDSAEMFLLAERPIEALRAYTNALAETSDAGQRAAIEQKILRLQQNTLKEEEWADDLESKGKWQEALRLRRQLGQWLRVGEICRQLGAWSEAGAAYAQEAESETSPTKARQWWATAGECYEQAQAWGAMVEAYRHAGEPLKMAVGLAAQGELIAAAELLADPEEPYPATAATYYQQAAEVAQAAHNRARRNPPAAALFEKAEAMYLAVGKSEQALACQAQADLCLNRPRLVLRLFSAEKSFQQGRITTIEGELYNQGAGPAQRIRLEAGGPALKMVQGRQTIYHVEDVSSLPIGGAYRLGLPLEPQLPSREDSPVEFKLWVVYEDSTGQECQNGPFSLAVNVLPNYVTDLPSAQTIHLHQPHSFYAGGDQVNIRPTSAGGEVRS